MDYADLEIGLHRRSTGSYSIEFRFTQPGSEADVRLGHDQPAEMNLDLEELSGLAYDREAYGRKLTESLFEGAAVQTAFAQARTAAQSRGEPLRLRLMIGSSAPELHSLGWETLRDPHDGRLLTTSENLLFSRYLSSSDWRPVRLRAKGELRALVAVANPTDLADYSLAPVDVPGELSRAEQGLGDMAVSTLPEEGGARSTLSNLTARLRETEYDVLYLVCHGAMIRGEPWLWLEDDEGNVGRTSGSELVTRLAELDQPPRLVVLASCESAGDGEGEAMAALGPQLAGAGVPAVVAMQGNISMETVAAFMPVFFEELRRDGQIDRALAVARGVVRDKPDFWMPALFMRLKSGRIWYVPGFGQDRDDFEKWQSLAGSVGEKTCTPIVGPALSDGMVGSRRALALSWAEKHGFPLSPEDRDVLPRVAQYIVTSQSPAYLPIAYREALRSELVRRYGQALPEELRDTSSWSASQLDRALDVVAGAHSEAHPADPYRLLAQLRLPIYIVTGSLDLMNRALVQEGAEPVVRICPWNQMIPKAKAVYEDEPTPEKPLVYHVFGHISVPHSVVYSVDNFFDYLIGVTLNRDLIPSAVRAALTSTSLLFLGFQLDDWEFRVFFRFLMTQEGRELLKFYSHAAAQVDPEEDRIVDVARTRDFLEGYFGGENIDIYWGSSDEFLRELRDRL